MTSTCGNIIAYATFELNHRYRAADADYAMIDGGVEAAPLELPSGIFVPGLPSI